MTDTPATGERLQKVLANAGLGSRRQIEEWIRAGRVDVNGQIAQLGDRVRPNDRVRLDGRLIQARRLLVPDRQILVYNKPEGELVTPAFSDEPLSAYAGEVWLLARVRMRENADGSAPIRLVLNKSR